jgi:hypothetical protein
MAGFGLDKKYGPRLQKNSGFLIVLVENLMAGMVRNVFHQFSSVVHFRKR